MSTDTLRPAPAAVAGATPVPAPALRPAASTWVLIAAVLLLPLLAYFDTAHSIVAIWQRSDTFAHGFLILPISAWLIWQRRDELARLPVQPCWPALALLALCGLAWLLADLGDVTVVRQYAFAAMLPLVALGILGMPLARAMAFPLFFILFAVPFGEIFTEPLIGWTANFTVDALRFTGIPVYRDGNHFTIPSGSWSVVEACSGVRYLISSVTLGCVYAYLTYRSVKRRAIFVVCSIIVPIIANGLRAYMIVMMGHLSGMTMAVGVDHLIYGWVFFGIVMFVLFWIGSFWREDHPEPPAPAGTVLPPVPPSAPAARLALAGAAIALCIGIWPAYQNYVERGQHQGAATVALAPFVPAWGAAPALSAWRPNFPPAAAELHQSYGDGGARAGVDLLYYRNAPEGTKLISSTNRLTGADTPGWTERGTSARTETVGTRSLQLQETILSAGPTRLLVWQWFWIDGATTSSGLQGKVLQVKQKLLHRRDDGAAVMVSAAYDEQPESARRELRAFLAANLPALESTLAATRAEGRAP